MSGIKSRVGMNFSADAEIVRGAEMRGGVGFGQIWLFECWKPGGHDGFPCFVGAN